MNFSNSQIQTQELPNIESVDLIAISKSYLKIIVFNAFIYFSIPFSILVSMMLFIDSDTTFLWLLLIVITLILVFYLIVSILGFSRRRYALREHDIIYASGLLFYKMTTVPFLRIQHIEISKSFIARKLNLATLHIYTAGEFGSKLVIKGLPNETAEKLNMFLSSKINEQL